MDPTRKINYILEGSRSITTTSVDKLPDKCPYCSRSIITEQQGHAFGENDSLQIQATFLCPNNNCKKLFIGIFNKRQDILEPSHSFYGTQPKGLQSFRVKEFDEKITEISPDFSVIYNQAFTAEQSNLHHISGMGYRKALEFLVKDYLCFKYPDDKEAILKKLLAKCIDDYIAHSKLKAMAKRAAWLGNDETHYLKRHTELDVNDLKNLIEITVHWISMELLTDEYEKLLPE